VFQKLVNDEHRERLRFDAAPSWPRRNVRRRFGLMLVAAGERLACGAPPRPRHLTH
jgi:hypothetical protein